MAKKSTAIPLPFTAGFYQSRSRPLAHQRCINWYPNILESAGISEESLYACSGLKDMVDAGTGVGRGGILFNGVLFLVVGADLIEITRTVVAGVESFSKTVRGSILGDGKVIMAATATQLAIVVPDNYAYIYTSATTTLTNIGATANFLAPACDVVQIDSYFVFAQTNTNKIFHSNLNNGLVFGALDQYTVVQYPRNVGLIVYRNTLYAMGESVTVPFTDQNQLEFAFRPVINSVLDIGLASSLSKTTFKDSFVFIGSGTNAERSVWIFNGQPQKISTEPIDFIIQNQDFTTVSKAFLVRHSQNGADFAAVQIGDYCFVYNLATQRWHEIRSRIPYGDDYIDAPWRVASITQAYNHVWVTDSATGKIGEISDSVYDEYGINIHRKIITQPFSSSGDRVRSYAIEAYFDVGNDSNDALTLSYSDDGGFKWSNKIPRSLGPIGEYGRRVVFDRLGAFSRSRMLSIEYTGKNPASFNKLMGSGL